MPKKLKNTSQGFTLIETLVGITVFIIISIAVWQGYSNILKVTQASRQKVTATALANEQFEIIRNLPYSDVGILGGIPQGKIPRTQTLIRGGTEFNTETTIRNIDDPFDGLIGGNPNDLSPADYKLTEVKISCTRCSNFQPLKFTTYVAPQGLETASGNGALFIQVFDANGEPVPGALVHIENNQRVPTIIIDEVTNNEGMLQIVDAPPGVEAYEITVTKVGYSAEQTYPTGNPQNPNPTKPHATVAIQEITQVSFAIDKLSTLNIASVTNTCQSVGNIIYNLRGSKLIGFNPDVYKYNQNLFIGVSGQETISSLEWDTYYLALQDPNYYLSGAQPLIPFNLSPNSTLSLKLIVAPSEPNSLLVTVKDASTELPLSEATVTLEKVGYSSSLITGRGFLRQTDWSGGAGQEDFVDNTKYFDSDGNIEINNPAGELKLKETLGQYALEGNLTSSTFDTGTASSFYQIFWQPQDQPPESGEDSVRFQIAGNNDKATWNFLGPDGTANTYYTLADPNINSIHNNNRYLRYKVYLKTIDPLFTPNLAELAFTYSSECIPSGQVLFNSLENAEYTLTVSKEGYQTLIDLVTPSSSWQEYELTLTP